MPRVLRPRRPRRPDWLERLRATHICDQASTRGGADPRGTRTESSGRHRRHREVVDVERRSRQIRKDTGFEWVTPHTFRKTVATLISEATTSELASRQLGHSSSQVTRDHYIAKPPVSADLSELLERLADSDDASADS